MPELLQVFIVPNGVAVDFNLPECIACLGPFEEVAVVAVPEAAMNKEHGIPLREDHVGFAGKWCMDTETKALGVEAFAQEDFGLGVLSPDAGHHPASNLRRDDVSHLQREGRKPAVRPARA